MPEAIEKISGTTVAFGDVVQLSKERSKNPGTDGFERYLGLEHLDPGGLKVRSWGDVADGTTFTSVFRPGQVLFGKRRAYQRKVAVADFSGVCSGDIYVLEPKGNHLLPELLPFICQSEPFYDYVISMSQGGLSPRVCWKALAKFEFALPPLEKQRRIAEVLQAWAVLGNRLREALAAAEVCKNAVLDRLFDPEAARRAFSQRNRKPAGDWHQLGEMFPLQPGFAFRSGEYSESGDRLLRGSNIAVDATSWDPKETKYWPAERRGEFADFILEE
ncbi:restriction endonuclease subunit S, partial [Gemmatimonadota bacterium]